MRAKENNCCQGSRLCTRGQTKDFRHSTTMSSTSDSHPELRQLRKQLQWIHDSIIHFQPPVKKPPILDSALEVIQNPSEDTHWLHHENIPGLKKLRETIRVDLDILEKVGDCPWNFLIFFMSLTSRFYSVVSRGPRIDTSPSIIHECPIPHRCME